MSQGVLCQQCGAMNFPGEVCGCLDGRSLRRSIYDAPRWRTYTRPIVIERDHGRCRRCGEPGNFVDHVLPIETLVELGADPFNPGECQLLCSRCSGRKDGQRSFAIA